MKNKPKSKETIIFNGHLVLPNAELNQAALSMQDGIITGIYDSKYAAAPIEEIHRRDGLVLNLDGDIIVPGLIDLHVHGCGGSDTMDANSDAMENMAVALLNHGTTAFLATTMTATRPILKKVFEVGKVFLSRPAQAEFLGFHMEGPCISSRYRGAQKIVLAEKTPMPVSSQVKIITLAPELSESDQFIQIATETGIIVSVGHSGASFEQMLEAIDSGIRHVTHAFNAMPGINHREPGLLTAALLDDRVTLELIADGVHIHPSVLELAIRLKTVEKVILVSDGTRVVGLPEGEYELGGHRIRLQQGIVSLPDGTIAGGSSPLLAAIRMVNQVIGRPLHEAVKMATQNPARLLNVDHRIGSLSEGREATFLRLSANLELKQVWQHGNLCSL